MSGESVRTERLRDLEEKVDGRPSTVTAGNVRLSYLDTGRQREKRMRATNNREPGEEAVIPEPDRDPPHPAEPETPDPGHPRTSWEDGTAVPYWVAPDDEPVEG